jgi:hypothetical protein
MTLEVVSAQIQRARADETNEPDEDIGFSIRWREHAAFNDQLRWASL